MDEIDITSKNQKSRVLVVDDETIALENLNRLLRKEGYSVVTADNGSDALNLLDASPFDVVITDLRMGKVNGMDVLKKAKSTYPATKVIIFTGYASIETVIEAMREGAFHYLEKPLVLDQVRAVIREAMI